MKIFHFVYIYDFKNQRTFFKMPIIDYQNKDESKYKR